MLFSFSVAAMQVSSIAGRNSKSAFDPTSSNPNSLTIPIQVSLFWSSFCLLPHQMATARAFAPPGNDEDDGASADLAADQAMVPLPHAAPDREPSTIPSRVAGLPVELDVSVPVRNFRVRNLLALEPSHLIESGWGHGDDVPLAAGDVQLAWSEFEVVDTQLAVRVTRLA
jgi:flagellar motor switch/type III secretory pathway protein FliN